MNLLKYRKVYITAAVLILLFNVAMLAPKGLSYEGGFYRGTTHPFPLGEAGDLP